METQNLTLRLPKPLLKKAKQLAAERGTTLTALVIEGLTRTTNGNEAYDAAWERQRALMREGRKREEAFLDRDALHER